MSKKDDRVFIQVQSKESERIMLKKIAKYRDMPMSRVIRAWIRQAYERLPEVAKK